MPEDSPSIYTIMAERVANAILGKINALIGGHNTNTQAHQDIRAKLPSYGSFTELQSLINNTAANGTLILEKDYKNTGAEEYITILHSMTIIGNGHTIDADSHNKIISIDDGNVESSFHDIIFLNGVCEEENGGAIYSNGDLGVFNCGFINCRGWYDGGAISGVDVTIKDSIFINCTASDGNNVGDGGAVYSYDGEIQDCLFINNHADFDGGAVFLVSPTKHIKNSLFLNNTALNEGGGVYSANVNNYEVYNCTFDQISTLYNTVNVGYITNSSVPNPSSTTPSADTTNGSVGDGTTWARSDHTHPKSSLYAEASHTHNNKEDVYNKVTSISSSSTDTQYPSAKAVYDATFSLDTLDCINENFTILNLPQIIFTYNEGSIDGTSAYILSGYNEGAYVDWGDGTPIETYELGDILEHEYSDNIQEHTIVIYGNINKLFYASFKGLSGITSINIPSAVHRMEGNTFYDCTGLTSVNLPQELIAMGGYNFKNCINLNTIILNWTETPLTYGMLMLGSPSSISPTFSIPYGTTSLYESKGYPTEQLVERSE